MGAIHLSLDVYEHGYPTGPVVTWWRTMFTSHTPRAGDKIRLLLPPASPLVWPINSAFWDIQGDYYVLMDAIVVDPDVDCKAMWPGQPVLGARAWFSNGLNLSYQLQHSGWQHAAE